MNPSYRVEQNRTKNGSNIDRTIRVRSRSEIEQNRTSKNRTQSNRIRFDFVRIASLDA